MISTRWQTIQPVDVLRLHSIYASVFTLVLALSSPAFGQDDTDILLEQLNLPELRLPRCFGFSDITELQALAICDALNLDQNVKARELSETWIRSEPNSPAAQFALAEVLFSVEGNMARALFHLNRAEELTAYTSMEEAFNSGLIQWHYLTLSQLSYVHQLMGDQIKSLQYLEKLNEIYGQEVESLRGWSLIKLKEYDAARESANIVLQNSEDERERARAWNTICAADLASLKPIESMTACERAIDEDETTAADSIDTVYLSNASEVSLSLLQMEQAEAYIDRATRYLNPSSVADPWIYKLYLTMNQGRFDEARESLDRMLVWRQSQDPVITVMNRAEHFLVSASFLLLAGYAEDSIRLTTTALNQPDRNGSYSADDSQKDSAAALLNMMANRTQYQIELERMASMDWPESLTARFSAMTYRLNAWRTARRAASLMADFEVLQNRLRPYAPLDVFIPEWVEPEIVSIIGTGVMRNVLEEARSNGAFMLNEGYYYAYLTEISAIENDPQSVIDAGLLALAQLPQQEVLLNARVSARMADASISLQNFEQADYYFETAYRQDPSILRRLELAIPVSITGDGSQFSSLAADYLARSPRFEQAENHFVLEVVSSPDLAICLKSGTGTTLSCYTMATDESQSSKWNAQQLVTQFHEKTFSLGYEISKAQRSILLGSSVILSSQTNANLQQNRDAVLSR